METDTASSEKGVMSGVPDKSSGSKKGKLHPFWTCTLKTPVRPLKFSDSQCHLFSVGIENLPFELQRNFQLMRDLDQRTEGMYRVRGLCV